MDKELLRQRLLTYPSTSEDLPFGPECLVYKVKGKMFALLAWSQQPLKLSLKAEPLDAVILRQSWPAITPGYHMNKTHWNTLALDGSLPEALVFEQIQNSFELVVAGMTKSQRESLGGSCR